MVGEGTEAGDSGVFAADVADDHEAVLGVLVRYIGGEDPRVARLRALADQK